MLKCIGGQQHLQSLLHPELTINGTKPVLDSTKLYDAETFQEQKLPGFLNDQGGGYGRLLCCSNGCLFPSAATSRLLAQLNERVQAVDDSGCSPVTAQYSSGLSYCRVYNGASLLTNPTATSIQDLWY
jgi:hypothetical protein